MSAFWSLVNIIGTLLIAMAASYFFVMAGLGVVRLRRQEVPLTYQALMLYGSPFTTGRVPASTDYHLYFLIACLNEAAVIARTVSCLRDPDGRARTVVVDDASEDATGRLAEAAGGTDCTVLRRELPAARLGKGPALNTGFRHICNDVAARGLSHDQVIVCVMDADGLLSDGALAEVLPLFDDSAVGGAQLAVRIRNRSDNFLLQYQDHQFWTLSSLTQFGRIGTDSVSLGGNGQFTRLSALLEIGEQPWSSALTEDLDLAVSMAVRGWKLTTTARAAVDQQGVARCDLLLRQRTRWYQGHMLTARRLPEIFRARPISHRAAIEMILYLIVPWAFDLPWSIVYHLLLLELADNASKWDVTGAGLPAGAFIASVYYLTGFWPALITAVLAKRRDRTASWGYALKMGHAFVVTNYISYICCWRALWRITRRQTGWTKTARVAESSTLAPR